MSNKTVGCGFLHFYHWFLMLVFYWWFGWLRGVEKERSQYLKHNSLNHWPHRRSECDSKNVSFNLVLLIGVFRSSHHNALRWMPQDLIDDKSALVQVMAWCRQATSHYLSQCWPRSQSPYGVTRLQNIRKWEHPWWPTRAENHSYGKSFISLDFLSTSFEIR